MIGRGAANRRARRIASEAWTLAVEELEAAGMLVASDGPTLQDYAQAVAQVDRLTRSLWAEGHTYEGRYGTVRNPAATVLGQVRGHLRSLRAELGLSPRGRVAFGRAGGAIPGAGDSDSDSEVEGELPVGVVSISEAAGWDV